MEAFAWTGVGIVALLLAAYFLFGIVGLLRDPLGRWFLFGWTLIGVAAWGVVGALYLLVQAVQ